MSKDTKVHQKWGFGMAPISETMLKRYDLAVHCFLEYLEGITPIENLELDIVSELKGMFNRCVRQDQWDWFSVYLEFGNPPFKNMRRIGFLLRDLRVALKEEDLVSCELIKQALLEYNIFHYLKTYQEDISTKSPGLDGGWIYILSTREQPKILKIGMTTRSVSTRIKEINSVTGVVFPFSARKVIRVTNPAIVEKLIHQELEEFRIRKDREFFSIEFSNAIWIIDSIIEREKLRNRQKGEILWFDERVNYGFIDAKLEGSIFLHKSQVVNKKELSHLKPGVIIEFDLGRNLKGFIGLNARIAGE